MLNAHLTGTGLDSIETHVEGSLVLQQDGESIHVTLTQALVMADVLRATALELLRQDAAVREPRS